MTMAIPAKWIDDVSPGDRPERVALRALQNRLKAVRILLARAIRTGPDRAAAIHELRIGTRRATATLRLFEEFLPRKRALWLRRQLQRIRRRAGAVRDCDVMAQQLGRDGDPAARDWRKSLQVEREKAFRNLVRLHARLQRKDRFNRRCRSLLKRIPRDAGSPPYGEWARRQLGVLVDQFFDDIPQARKSEAGLHRLRIRGKALRYALELLSGVFPPTLRTKTYAAYEELQNRLGEVTDLSVAKGYLAAKRDQTKGTERTEWQQRHTETRARFTQARIRFWKWCTTSRLNSLRRQFERALTSADSKPSRNG